MSIAGSLLPLTRKLITSATGHGRSAPVFATALVVSAAVLLTTAAPAYSADPFAPPGTVLVRVAIPERDVMNALHTLGIDPEEAGREHVSFRVLPSQLRAMRDLGLRPEMWDGVEPTVGPEPAFTSYAQMVAELNQTVLDHPSIARLVSVGQTVQGRAIWALAISDNVATEEFEPEVRICGAHHGNERMAVEMCLNLAQHLTDNYGVLPAITSLVDGREIWVVPMVNPDGVEANSRYNAHSVDLNRNYGYMWESGGGSSGFSEPETRAMRELATDNTFVVSLSFHTSGDIVNSVWNYSPTYTEDDAIVWELTEGYAAFNGYWAVRGWYWYETHGDCNDWSYGARGDLDWTIEVSNSNETTVWNQNRDAMLYIIDAPGRGMHGRITDAMTGEPLRARVSVDGSTWMAFTDPALGDYHRILPPGTYTVRIEANGYQAAVVPNVVIPLGGAATLDVQMHFGGGHFADRVEIANVPDPTNAYANATVTMALLGAPDGLGSSIGKGGEVVMDLGPESAAQDGGGSDLIVYEAPQDASGEGFRLYGGASYLGPWTLIGTGGGTTSFDLGPSGLSEARYLRVVDDGDGSSTDPFAGFDVDAIEAVGSTVGLPDLVGSPGRMPVLEGVWPNPAASGRGTEVSFRVSPGSPYNLELVDVGGKVLLSLDQGRGDAFAAKHSVRWVVADGRGKKLGPGVYFVRLYSSGRSDAQKLVVVR